MAIKSAKDLYKDRDKLASQSRIRSARDRVSEEDLKKFYDTVQNNINYWMDVGNSFVDSTNSYYNNLDTSTYGLNSSNLWKNSATARSNWLTKEADNIDKILTEYGRYFDSDWISNVRSAMSSVKGASDSILKQADKDIEYWQSWDEVAKKSGMTAEEAYMNSYFTDKYSGYSYEDILKASDEIRNGGKQAKGELSWLNDNADYFMSADEAQAEIDAISKEWGLDDMNWLEKANDKVQDFFRGLVGAEDPKYGWAEDRIAKLTTIKSNAERKEKLDSMVAEAKGDAGYNSYIKKGKAEGQNRDDHWEGLSYNVAYASDIIAVKEGKAMASGDGFYQKFINAMDEEQYNNYVYFFGKYGKDVADEYLRGIETEINEKEGQRIKELADIPLIDELFHVTANFERWASDIGSIFNDDYEAPSAIQIADQMLGAEKEGISKALWDLEGNIAYQIPNMLGGTVATSILGPAGFGLMGAKTAGMVGQLGLTGLSSFGGAKQEMLNLGYSEGQAFTYGALTAASEIGLGALLGKLGNVSGVWTDDAIKSFTKGINSAGAKFAIEFGAGMASEGLEEALQEILSPVFMQITTGKKSEGIDWGQVAYAGMLGALSAGVLNGLGAVGTRANELSTARKIKGNESKVNKLKEIGNTFSADTLAYKLASKVDSKTGAWKLADVIHEMNGTLSEQNIADIKYQLERNEVLPKDAQTIAEWLAKAVDGENLTAMQRKALDNNPIISKVFKETIIDQNSTVNQRLNALMDIYGQSGHAGVDYAELAKAQSNKGLSESATFNQYVEGAKKEAIKSKYGIGRSESTNAMLDSMVAETKALMHNAKVNEGGKTTDTTTGKEVSIKKVKDAKAKMLELADGSTINSKSIEYSNDDEAILYETVLSRGYDTDTANAVISGLKAAEGLSVTQYLNGVDEAIEYGKIGYPMDKISTDGFYADLSDSMKKFAYNLGKDIATKETASAQARVDGAKGKVVKTRSGNVIIDEDIKGMTSRQEASITTLGKMVTDITHSNVHIFESVEKVINGKKVRVFAKDTAGFKAGTNADNGFYDKSTGDIYIDLHAGANAEGVILWTAAHELTHFIHQWSPAKFKVLADFLMAEYGKQGVDIQTLIDNKIAESKRKKLTRDEAYEEVVADAMQSMFTDANLASKVEKLKNTDKGLWNKIKQFFRDLYKRITKEYEGLEAQTWEDHFVRQMSKDTIGRLSDLFAEALVDAGDTYANVDIDAVASGEVMYSPRGDVLSWDIAWDSDNHSSIKEQLKAHLDEVNSMQPVASVNYDKTKGKPYYEQLDEILRTKFGYKIERQDHGSITFDKDAIKGARGYVDSDAEAAALIVAPYILKRGKAISGHKDHKGKGYPSIVYAAPATLNGEVGNVAVSVLYGGARRVHSLRVLTPSGKEFILAKIKNTEPTTSGASPKSDVEPTISPVLSGNRIAQNPDSVNSSEKISFSERKEAPPTKTEKAYKLMRLSNGKLYPLFIGNNEEVRVGTWYNADSPNLSQLKNLAPGTHLVDMKTGEAMTWDEYAEKHVPKKNGKPKRSKPNIDDVHWANDNGYRFMHIEEKAGGKSETEMVKKYGDTRAYYNWGVNGSSKTESGEGSASLYALRPGWHFGEVPSMHQIGYDGENGDTVRLDNQVWVEVEMSADVDYNAEAEANWSRDIPTHIPTNGYYRFATNPTQKKTKGGDTENDATKADWYVAGAFKVNRIMSDSEADAIVENYNKKHGKNVPLDYRRNHGRVFNAETMSIEDRMVFSERNIVDIPNNKYVEMYNHFGSTKNYDVAGYMLGNGVMLDFSGKHWGDDYSTFRQVDHRDVQEVLDDRGNNGVNAMIDMIGNGNIRLMPEVGGINLAVKPNATQMSVLRGYINHFKGEVVIDIDKVGGDTIHSFSYTRGTSSSKVLSDLKAYFDEGIVPEQKDSDETDIRQFLFSERGSTIYIKDGHTEDGGTVDFINLILDGKKKGETRTHKNLTRKWVGIAKDGKVYGRVRFGEPYLIDKNSPEYKDSYIKGTEYDLKENEQKYYYPILETEDFRDNPKPIEKNGNYGTYSYSERILMGSLFSGGGTLEAGLVYQMLDKEFAVEYKAQLATVYTDNHGKEHMFVGDVRDFDSKGKRNVFYLHASPSCPNYSPASNKGGETETDIITAEATARILEEQMPQVFTVENVKRYIGSAAYNIIANKLTKLGYKWDVDVYKASDYGNATKRERMIIRAVKDGELPAKPAKVANITSWGEATRDLWETDLIPSNLVKSKIEAIRNTPKLKDLRLTKLDKPLLIYDTNKRKQVSYAWVDELAPTLTTKCGDARIIMPDGKVYAPTPKFMGRIQGLPDNYKYPKATTTAFKIIGNGIPTQLTKAVIGGVLDSAYEQTHNGDILYSERRGKGNTEKIGDETYVNLTDFDRLAIKFLNALHDEESSSQNTSSTEVEPSVENTNPTTINRARNLYQEIINSLSEEFRKEAPTFDEWLSDVNSSHQGFEALTRLMMTITHNYKPMMNSSEYMQARKAKESLQNKVWELHEMRKELREDNYSFSERNPNAIDNRSLLANALESVAQNDVEKSWLAKYKTQIADLNEKQNKLAEIRAEIQKTRFTKGADRSKLTELENNAKTLANQINRADKKLLELEASKALKGVVERERAKAYQLGKAKVDEYRKDRAESTARSYYTPRIEKVVSDLRNRLEHPSAKNAIPEAFGASVAKVLSAFNFTTYDKDGKPRPSKANMSRAESQMALVELANQLSQNSLESQYGQLDIPPEMLEWIKEMTTYFEAASNLASGEFTINKMNEVQLKNIYKFLRSLQTTINKAGKYYTNASYDVASDAKSTMEHLAPLPSQTSDRGQLLSKMLAWDLASPVTVFDRFGEGGKHVYNMLIKGQSKEAYNVQKILDFVDKAYTAKEAKEWRETLVPITIDGKEYKVTIAYLMGLHCLLKQEDSKRHILEGGGIRFGDVKHKGKTTRFTDTFFKEADAIEVENILDKYPRAREVAEAMQKFMEETGSAWGNEVSMIRFGYHAFTIKGYYPIRTIAAGSEYEAQQKRANIYALLNKSFTKERTPGANNVVIVDDIFSVFNNHMSEMALYNAWAMPVIDAIKWFNYRESQDVLVEKSEKSVHESLRLAYGNNADEYVRRLFESINGQKGGGLSEALASYMLRKVNRVAVAGNLRVAIQQPFSVVRAYELINAKYVTPLLGKARDVAYEEMLANSGIAKWKSMGYYDVNVSMPLESKVFKNETLSDKATDKLMKAAEDGDAFTWAMLWNACKKETKEKNPKLEGEELLKKTAERFDDLVLRTQVVDSVLAKSQWMRSSGFFHKSSSSFMSEPLTSYNALLRQYDKYSRDLAMHGAKYATKNNIKGIGKAMSIYVLAQVVNAIATAPLDAMRDDDDYETYLEKLLAHFKDNAVSNLMPWNMLPWISDIADYFIYGRLDRPDLALATNVIDFAKSIDKTIDNYSYYKLHNTFKQGLEVSSQISGLPVSNLWRDAVSIWNTVVSPFGYGELKFQTQADKASVAYKKMYEALFNGNEDRAENLYGQLMSNGVDVDKVYSGVSNLIKEDVKNGNITTEEAIERMMTLLGFTGKTDSDGKPITENDVYWQVDKWNYTNENGGNSEGYSKYDDIFTAMEEGDPTSAIEWHIENKMNVYLEEAKAKAEEEGKYFNEVKAKREAKSKAESAIKSAITSYWKPLYKEAYKNKNDEEMKRIRYMLKATKLYGTTSELLDTVKGWLKD